MTISQVETELKQLNSLPPWGRKQQDDWDKLSNPLVYSHISHADLQVELQKLNKGQDFDNYVVNRWYNTLSAFAVESIFSQSSNVIPNKNKFDKLVDFTISGIKFDHKTSVFPKGYGKTLAEAQANPTDLILWLYKEQSSQGRYHTANRLFIILYHTQGRSYDWQLRREFGILEPAIQNYALNFNPNNLKSISIEQGKTTLSDIIWIIK